MESTKSEEVNIREAEVGDIPDILLLYQQLQEDDKILSPDQAVNVFHKIHSNPDHKIYILTVNQTIIGTLSLIIINSLTNNIPLSVAEDIVIDNQWRRRGFGKLLVQFAMNISRLKGCYKLMLSSHLTRTNAHEFYKSLGFEIHGYSFIVNVDQKEIVD